MRLWQLTFCAIAVMAAALGAVVWIGKHPLVIPNGPATKWGECAKPADDMARNLCAEFR